VPGAVVRFYIVHDSTEATIGCETTLAAAHALGRDTDPKSYGITRVDCPVNVETVRRLLGNLGGYAIDSSTRDYSSQVRK
jgi:hypothetical protein